MVTPTDFRDAFRKFVLNLGKVGFQERNEVSPRPVLVHPADVAEHVRMNVQADVRQVVNVLGRHEPDDLADLPLGKMQGKARECIGIDPFLLRQLGHVIQRSAFGLGVDEASWIPTAYNMTLMSMGPFSVYLGAFLGVRRVLLCATPTFIVASILLPLSPNLTVMLALEVIAGISSGTSRAPSGMPLVE